MRTLISCMIMWIVVLITGCSFPHYYYSPNVQNVPLFTDSYELSGLVAGSAGDVNRCLELQAGFAFPRHIALTAGFLTGGNDRSGDGYTDFAKIRYFESSLGYYTAFKNIGVFEIYGGFGLGSQDHTFAYSEYEEWFYWSVVPDGKADLTFSKFFIQPNIGIKEKWIEGAFSCRVGLLNFDRIHISNSVYHFDEVNMLIENRSPWLIEPTFTLRAGSKAVKGQIQCVLSKTLTEPDLKFEKIRLSAGLFINLSVKGSEN